MVISERQQGAELQVAGRRCRGEVIAEQRKGLKEGSEMGWVGCVGRTKGTQVGRDGGS